MAVNAKTMSDELMDKITHNKMTIFLLLSLMHLFAINCATAESLPDTLQTTAGVSVSSEIHSGIENTGDQHGKLSSSMFDQINRKFPGLERALLIITIVNFIIILFASGIYLARRRMQQFSPAVFARQNQVR